MSEAATQWISPEEYLELEARAETKSEYFDGEIFAMAGTSFEHNLICSNLMYSLRSQLGGGPCLVVGTDQRILVSPTDLYTYPDLTVVCSKPELVGPRPQSLVNPTLLVEVLSESTEHYDRGQKFEHYRRIATLKEYVLVSSDRRLIECRTRKEGTDEWMVTFCADLGGRISLHSIGCSLEQDEVYRNVELPEPETRKPCSPRG